MDLCVVDWGLLVGVIQVVLAALALIVAVAGVWGVIMQMRVANKQRFFELKLNLICLINDLKESNQNAIIDIANFKNDLDLCIRKNKENSETIGVLNKADLSMTKVKDNLVEVDQILKGLSDKLIGVSSTGGVKTIEVLTEKTLPMISRISELKNSPHKLRAQLISKNISFPST